jgi:hypothetical protein
MPVSIFNGSVAACAMVTALAMPAYAQQQGQGAASAADSAAQPSNSPSEVEEIVGKPPDCPNRHNCSDGGQARG